MATPILDQINISDYDLGLSRERADSPRGFAGLAAKRPTAWQQYGYTADLHFADFRQAYERGEAGHGAVHRLLDRCWSEWPRIKEPAADEHLGVCPRPHVANGTQEEILLGWRFGWARQSRLHGVRWMRRPCGSALDGAQRPVREFVAPDDGGDGLGA